MATEACKKVSTVFHNMEFNCPCIQNRNNQSLKGAVVMVLCQNEAEVKFPMEIDHNQCSQFVVTLTTSDPQMRCGGQLPWEILLLSHSDRGLRQLLLSIPD